jgi:hypothetical protein
VLGDRSAGVGSEDAAEVVRRGADGPAQLDNGAARVLGQRLAGVVELERLDDGHDHLHRLDPALAPCPPTPPSLP